MNKAFFSLLVFFIYTTSFSQVKVYEGKEEIPTYKRGADELSPIFYTGRGVQGAAGHMYPYPAQTNLGDSLSIETYNMVYLENEYLKITIMPQFGGKLFSAIDKTNGHELFHRNSVIKPDLIGTLGAWISGGIEWCFPHHHRTTTLLPSDYFIAENGDGSATVWIGETERDLRLRGIIGITLRPGCSYIEAEYHLNNTSEVTRNFLFWANVSITANENFRTFWPPSQEIGVFHSNTSFTHWPISHEIYRGIDYTSGVDLTWWKNHPDPVSFFFWQGKEGFIGGYDYAQKAGTIHVGNVLESKASKLWQFGPGLQGQNARRKLTDDGKAYVELMTGTFSNNQPDYGWFAPHAVKEAKNYWYPIRDLEIVKNANTDASVTLQMRNEKTVFYGFNTTRLFAGAKVTLRNGDEILNSETIDIDPATPYTSTYKSKMELDEYQLYAELKDRDGNILVSYRPYRLQHPELPDIQERPELPREIESVEDLYLTGRFVEQFSRPGFNPDDYYLKALEISPDDYRVNIALGIRRVHQWRYEEAEFYLQKAADKLRVKYFQPKEGELFYYLGLAQLALGKAEDAYRNFSQSTWYNEWHSSGFYQLALMESNEGHYTKALEYIKKAYSTNNHDGRISILYSALLRKSGEKEKARSLMDQLIQYDPINFSAYYERELIQGNHSINQWQKYMQDVDNNYLEISVNYMNAGMLDEGIHLLTSLDNPTSPLVDYYLAWFYSKNNQPEKAHQHLMAAGKHSIDYCFPYRKETLEVFEKIIMMDPGQAIPYYLLGNLLYDKRPDDAIKAWNKALEVDENFGMVWRNLAFGAFYYENDVEKAIEYIKKAIEIDGDHPIWYAELENYYDESNEDFKECLEIMAANIDVVKNDITAPKSLVKLFNLNGEYDKAITLLEEHHFRTWEGGRDIYFHYVDAHTLKALELIEGGKLEGAISELEKAMQYPENLEVGKPLDDERNAMIYYIMGQAYEKKGEKAKANECFKKSIDAKNSSSWPDLLYYQARAYEKLGDREKAEKIYQELITNGNNQLEEGRKGSGIGIEENSILGNKSISEAYFLKALGSLGLKKNDEAKMLFGEALKVYKNNLWARIHMRSMI
jgi:tetratricopeptide (TPR) repeat protein